ncbi:MAG: penicillin-binding protein 1C [Planctomycetota bacterium]
MTAETPQPEAKETIAAPSTSKPKRPRWRRWLRLGALASGFSVVALVVTFLVCDRLSPFPMERLDGWPASPQVYDRTGQMVLITVGEDDQWRRPIPLDAMGEWLPCATIAVEDERFDIHFGVDPVATLRAVGQNLSSGRVVSGASTLTMQLCKMLYNDRRTVGAKVHESFRAVQLERLFDKEEILERYLNIAPYGGNLRGVEAAARRYFGKACADLTLGEASLIAGLPQSPTRLRPDRHLDRALERRRTVLERMLAAGMIDEAQLEAVEATPLRLAPTAPLRPRRLEHAAWWARTLRRNGGRTTFDLALQTEIERTTVKWGAQLPDGTDLAVTLIHVPTGEVRAMVGSLDPRDPRDGQVNGAVMRRSPGSTLKPFVYATAIECRRLEPETSIDDRPIERAGWAPTNFDGKFRGRVTAAEALRRSLNIPAVLVTEAVGLSRAVDRLERAGVDLPADAASRSGLALITGATEVRLLDLTNGYATLARGGLAHRLRVWLDEPAPTEVTGERVFSEATCRVVSDVLGSHRRTPVGYERYPAECAPWFMWKTGTSSLRRDAWAVGHNGEWAIGVWAGSFSGAGHASYVGVDAAEPLLAELFALPAVARFVAPSVPETPRVVRPYRLTRSKGDAWRIVQPEDGAKWVATNETVTLRPRHNGPPGSRWFLNGILQPTPWFEAQIGTGHHELRVVAPNGESSHRTASRVASGSRSTDASPLRRVDDVR